MNVILGITENYLQRGKLAPDIQDGFEKIFNAGGLLLSIINDILDLSKIEAGKLELIPAKYDMVSLINDVSHMNLLRFDHKPIEFKLRIAENIPLHVFGDALRIKQILNNLLTNAFKYTDSGEVVLAVSAENTARTDGDMVTLVYSVSDTGYGMTAEQIAKLFDEYAHVPGQEANRTSTGIGLGMAITHNLVDLMHGELFVDSTPGRGSTFTCRLPQKRIGSDMLGDELAENLQKFHFVTPAQAKKVRIVRDPMPYGKVLVVDDMASNIDVARLLLAPYGLQIDSAESGFEAIDIIKSGKVYDIVFMDHMMPKMDGVEAVRIIRESGYAHPILALTADAILGQAKMFLSKGFDDFISKPIDIRRLNALLNKFVRDRQPREVVEAARRQAKRMHEPVEVTTPQPGIAPTLAKTFRRDAARAIAVLEDLAAKAAETTYTDEDRRLYTVTVHGMKSALANVGEVELSSVAAKLEKAGRARDDAAASAQTPAFLNALREVVEKITLREDAGDGGMPGDERAYWREKLLAIKMACTAYDKKAAKDALGALAEKSWPPPAKDLLDTLAELLLHSKFKEIARIVDKETSTD
jgi:CheY-like chemotaxis protein/two-component sensor histidine kinase